jgi:hypothetical protein
MNQHSEELPISSSTKSKAQYNPPSGGSTMTLGEVLALEAT